MYYRTRSTRTYTCTSTYVHTYMCTSTILHSENPFPNRLYRYTLVHVYKYMYTCIVLKYHGMPYQWYTHCYTYMYESAVLLCTAVFFGLSLYSQVCSASIAIPGCKKKLLSSVYTRETATRRNKRHSPAPSPTNQSVRACRTINYSYNS